MAISLNKSLVKQRSGPLVVGTVIVGFFTCFGTLLNAISRSDDMVAEVEAVVEQINNTNNGGRDLHITDGDVVSIQHNNLSYEYNFRTRLVVITDGDELNTLPFTAMPAEATADIQREACATSTKLHGALSRLHFDGMGSRRAREKLHELETGSTTFAARYCVGRP